MVSKSLTSFSKKRQRSWNGPSWDDLSIIEGILGLTPSDSVAMLLSYKQLVLFFSFFLGVFESGAQDNREAVLSDPPGRSLKQYRLPPELIVSGNLGDSWVLINASPAAGSLFSYVVSSKRRQEGEVREESVYNFSVGPATFFFPLEDFTQSPR